MTQKIKPLIFDTTGSVEGNVLAIVNGVPKWTSSISTASQWGAITGSLIDQVDISLALSAKEAVLPLGATTQYLRGDKTWQTLNKVAVGLGQVDNTSDVNKPVSVAVAAALAAQRTIASIQGLQDALDSKASATDFTRALLANTDVVSFRLALGLGSAATSSSGDFAASNHIHALASSTQDGFMSLQDKAKISGIQSGATANSTDAQLRDRGTHTGAQALATILGLDSALSSKLNTAQFSPFGLQVAATPDATSARILLGLGSAANSNAGAFAPVLHTHVVSDIAGLSITLAGLAPKASPALTGNVTVSGTVTSVGEMYVGSNRVFHAGDSIPAATLGGVSASGFALVNHTHGEFAVFTAAIGGKEPAFGTGTLSQFLRGDKTWQAIDKVSVGLGAVDNTPDLQKPVSNATQAVFDTKASLSNPVFVGVPKVGSSKIFHEGNDGTGSGLDADTLRGKIDTDFAAASHTHPYAPLVHQHVVSNITGLQILLDKKADLDNPIFTGTVTLSSDPVLPMEAATRQYVDHAVQGLNTKQSVICATTGPIALTGTQTIDGIMVAVGDRVLVKSQSDPAQNGIYIASAGVWGRSLDIDVWAEVNASFVFVERGTTLGSSGWVASGDATGTIGTTPILWAQFSGGGTYTATSGITKSGSDFSLSVMPARTLKGNISSADSTPGDLTPAQVSQLLPLFTAYQRGQVPPSGGGSSTFLRADGAWSSASSAWGLITGNIAAQGDLAAALATKAPLVSPTFSGGLTLSSGVFSIPSSSNHQIGNLLIQNGGGNSPLIKSVLDNPAIIFGSFIKLQSDNANRICAPSGVSTDMSFETGRGGVTGFKWLTAPTTNDVFVEQMHLTSSGYLGLGTAAPTERLEVIGNIRAAGNIYANGYRVWTAQDALNATTLMGLSPSAFATAQHSHEITDVNGLRAELDAYRSSDSNHSHTMAQIIGLSDALGTKENSLPVGNTSQYLRGDKTWQTLNKASVGLSQVDNTSDAAKPLSIAASQALAGKLSLAGGELTGDLFISESAPILTLHDTDGTGTDLNGYISFTNSSGIRKAFVGFSSGSFEISSQIGDLVLTPAGVVRIGSSTVFHSGNLSKASIGLSNVDNTSDLNKPISTATQSALDGKLSVTHEGAGGAVHAIATTVAAGFMASTDKSKLNGISSGATANTTDALLRDRATHTGSQPTSSVSGLDAALNIRVIKGAIVGSGLTASQPSLVGRSATGAGALEEIVLSSGFTLSSGQISYTVPDGLRGDIAVVGSSWGIVAQSITDSKLSLVPQGSFKARQSAGVGSPENLTGDQATALLSIFTTSQKGLVPNSGGGTANFLRADGVWMSPPNTGIWGQISGTIADQTDLKNALAAKQSLSGNLTALAGLSGATDRLPYFDSSTTLALSPLTALGRSLIGSTSALLAKTALGIEKVDNTSDANKPVSIAGQAALDQKIGNADRGVTVATLDATGKIPNNQLPPLAIHDTFVVSSEAAQLALTVQNGDIAVRSDIQTTYIRNNGTSGTISDWTELQSAGRVASINGRTGAVNLSKADVALGNVDNTADVDKPVSTLQAQALTNHITSPTGHAIATASQSGFMSAIDKTKLDALQDRSNQTGTQSYNTISLPQQTILGRTTTGTGAGEAIAVGTGLSLANGTLSINGVSFNPITTTGTGVSQTITLPQSGMITSDLLVTVEGLVQNPSDFSLSGTNLSIVAPLGSSIVVRKPAGATGPAGSNSVSSVKRTADGSVTSATLVNDDQLSILLDSGATYEVRGMLLFDASAGGYQVNFSPPLGSTGFTNTGADFFVTRTHSQAGISVETISGVVMTDTTSGLLVLRWSQASSNATPTRLKKGSHIILTRLP